MKPSARILSAVLLVLTLAIAALAQAPATAPRAISKAEFERMMTELSNWGRWGKADELGAVNLITPAKRKAAAQLVREGITVSLSHEAEKEVAPDNPRPFGHEMLVIGSVADATAHSDAISVAHHGLAHTHLDSLCHYFYNGKMYNGFTRDEVTKKGAAKLSVYNFRGGIFTRAILFDIPRLKNVPYLEPGTPIYPEDLDAWEKFAKVKVQPGDIVLISTGRWARRKAVGAWPAADHLAGLHASSVRWLKSRDIAMLGSDAASDVRPTGVEGMRGPVHTLILVAMGTPILDNLDLTEVSAATNQRKRWEFLLSAAPLAIPGATGSPFNPIAVF